MANYSRQLYVSINTQLPRAPHSSLSGHPNPYQPIQNPAAFTTILSTLHKYMAPPPHILTDIHQYRHTYSYIPTVIYPQWLDSPPPPYQTHPTNIGIADKIMEHRDMQSLQISDSHYEKKSTQLLILSIFLIVTVVILFARWESQRDKNYSLWENLFSYQANIFSFWERIGNEKRFFVSLRLPLFSPRYIALKLNQKITSKISNYLT